MSEKPHIRVLVVDDHAIVRDGIRSLLGTEPDILVVGEAANGRDGVEQAERLRPDVILMDLAMPHLDGIEATRQILLARPDTRVLVLTSFAGDDQVVPAIKAGASGYLLKDSDSQELVQAIHEVYRGESALDSKVASVLLREMRAPSHPPAHGEPTPPPALTAQQAAKVQYGGLTGREREVAVLVAQGKSNAAIAAELVLTVRTVEAHVTRILDKLGFSSRTQVAAWAIGHGLATPPESLDEQMRSD